MGCTHHHVHSSRVASLPSFRTELYQLYCLKNLPSERQLQAAVQLYNRKRPLLTIVPTTFGHDYHLDFVQRCGNHSCGIRAQYQGIP